MAMDLDSYLGIHAQALQVRARRTELLATNLANADTPGYKARDIDFKSAIAAAMGPANTPSTPLVTNARHIGIGGSSAADSAGALGGKDSLESFLKYRTPLAPSLDGNTVDAQLEQAAFADNTVRYQATLQFLSGRFRSLMTAITGQ